mmetsp:Transcript_4801/g.7420  ORF Transcript_4801/g.7420 Transcript_4801/m.7420 type:complete len:251 (-) Transcript_4801:20-772(-)
MPSFRTWLHVLLLSFARVKLAAFLVNPSSDTRGRSIMSMKTVLSNDNENDGSDHDLTETTCKNSNYAQMIVVFGRPGAGKTTIANEAASYLQENCRLELDLDVCVPQWMRDNFSKGIYPTLQQRYEFAEEACNYLNKQIEEKNKKYRNGDELIVLVSFSFVNTDLREVFRQAFPDAQWALVDTTVIEADRRIKQREGHFYTGAPAAAEKELDNDIDNSEWEFAPVSFKHTILPGGDSVEENAKRVIRLAS